jgi:hypothetical protein
MGSLLEPERYIRTIDAATPEVAGGAATGA